MSKEGSGTAGRTALLHLHASTPGLGLQGTLVEDPGVNLGVDFAGATSVLA